MKQIDNETTKGNRCHVFQELVNRDEMLHSPQGFKSFRSKKATSKYTLGNIGWCLGGMK